MTANPHRKWSDVAHSKFRTVQPCIGGGKGLVTRAPPNDPGLARYTAGASLLTGHWCDYCKRHLSVAEESFQGTNQTETDGKTLLIFPF